MYRVCLPVHQARNIWVFPCLLAMKNKATMQYLTSNFSNIKLTFLTVILEALCDLTTCTCSQVTSPPPLTLNRPGTPLPKALGLPGPSHSWPSDPIAPPQCLPDISTQSHPLPSKVLSVRFYPVYFLHSTYHYLEFCFPLVQVLSVLPKPNMYSGT